MDNSKNIITYIIIILYYHINKKNVYLFQVGSYSYDMTKMLFKVSKLTFIHKQSIILDYSIEIRNLHEKDKIFLAGALGNYSLAGFEMVSNNVSWVIEFLTCEHRLALFLSKKQMGFLKIMYCTF